MIFICYLVIFILTDDTGIELVRRITKLRIEYMVVKPPVELPVSGDVPLTEWFRTVNKTYIRTVT